MKGKQELYDSDGYKLKLAEVEELRLEDAEERRLRDEEKKRKTKAERTKLKKIFTEERCGKENMHFVLSLIDRAAFLKVELEYLEDDIQKNGCTELFIQGTQCMYRENPLSKVHVQYVKNYKDVISKLESYDKDNSAKDIPQNPLTGLIGRANAARSKYQK